MKTESTIRNIDGLIPHRPPMLAVTELMCGGEGLARSRGVFSPDSIFLNAEGLVDEAVYFEMIAQTFAAFAALQREGEGVPSSLSAGYLVSIKKMALYGAALVSEPVETLLKEVSPVEDFFVVEGEVRQNGRLLASGRVTIYIPEAGAA